MSHDSAHAVSPFLSLCLSLSVIFCVSLVIHATHSPRVLRLLAGSASQLENTELSNGIVQDDPEIIALQNDKVDILLHCIKSSTRDAAWIYGQVLCQIIRDLVPPNEILTKVIKEFLAINQPHGDVIATIVYQVSSSQICCPASWSASEGAQGEDIAVTDPVPLCHPLPAVAIRACNSRCERTVCGSRLFTCVSVALRECV